MKERKREKKGMEIERKRNRNERKEKRKEKKKEKKKERKEKKGITSKRSQRGLIFESMTLHFSTTIPFVTKLGSR